MNLLSTKRHLDTNPHRPFVLLTSRSNQHQRGADRCTACKRCPSRFPPGSTASPRTHTQLQHMANSNLDMFLCWERLPCNKILKDSHLESQSGTPEVQQSQRWPRWAETLQLQPPCWLWWAPSSSGRMSQGFLFSFMFPHLYILGCHNRGEEVGSTLGLERILYFGMVLALQRSRCASVGMNLQSHRKDDTSMQWLSNGGVEGRRAGPKEGEKMRRKMGNYQRFIHNAPNVGVNVQYLYTQ